MESSLSDVSIMADLPGKPPDLPIDVWIDELKQRARQRQAEDLLVSRQRQAHLAKELRFARGALWLALSVLGASLLANALHCWGY